MVVALNMMDEVAGSGGSIDIQKISAGLGVPVVPISASKNEGVAELVTVALRTVQNNERPKHHDFCKGEVHRAIHSLAHMIEDHAEEKKIPLRFAATKLVEGDEAMMDKLEINQNEREIVQHVADEMEAALGTDREAAWRICGTATLSRSAPERFTNPAIPPNSAVGTDRPHSHPQGICHPDLPGHHAAGVLAHLRRGGLHPQ